MWSGMIVASLQTLLGTTVRYPVASRRNINVGDWIVGTGSKHNVSLNKLIYAMNVTERITFDQY